MPVHSTRICFQQNFNAGNTEPLLKACVPTYLCVNTDHIYIITVFEAICHNYTRVRYLIIWDNQSSTFSEISEANGDAFSNTCVGHRSFLLSLLLAVKSKITRKLWKSVSILWRWHLPTGDALGLLLIGFQRKKCNGQCDNMFLISLFYLALSFSSKTG